MLKQFWMCLQWNITACLLHTWMFVPGLLLYRSHYSWFSPSKSLEGIMSGRKLLCQTDTVWAAATSIFYIFNRSSCHFMIWLSLASLHQFTLEHECVFLTFSHRFYLIELAFVKKIPFKMRAYIKLVNNLVYCLFLTRPPPRSWDQCHDSWFVMVLWQYICSNINFV